MKLGTGHARLLIRVASLAACCALSLLAGPPPRAGWPLRPFDLRPILKEGSREWKYIRLEGSTRNQAKDEYRCYTNPIWIEATAD